MERQRSFSSSFKPTRLLLFSFTIFSSFLFLSIFTIWLINSTPPSLRHHQPLLHFNASSSPPPPPLQSFTTTTFTKNFTTDVQISSLIDNRLARRTQKKTFSGIFKSEEKEEASFLNLTAMHNNGTSSTGRIFTNQIRNNILEEEATVLVGKSTQLPISNKTVVKKRCDLTHGYWVFDESYHLYHKDSCPFIDEGFDCEGNGRLDTNYSKWRWQPKYCDLPRFNATRMLESIRGKRLVFVGDSINRNQWESMMCMLQSAIKDPKGVYESRGRRITKEKGNYSFRFLDYQCTVEYYVSHFLVHESKARVGQKRRQTLRIDAIDHGSSRWRGADILVFNTAHWWSHYKTKAGIYYYQEGTLVHPQLNVSTAFRKALKTWSSWVDKRINPMKTQVFFRTSAPSHFRGGNWNSGGHCREATHPLNETLSTNYPDEKNIIIEETIKQMKTPVTLLNITSLSGFRIDGHPSIYGRKTQKSSIQDCSHWCLPGVPDTWNELLYFYLLSR